MPQYTYPGVYIQEFTPATPIEGVGTSVAAFLAPFSDGPLNDPTKVVSWDDFKRRFGELPLPGTYGWYAVRGFFQQGGTICYVTRVSNATFAQVKLQDVGGHDSLVVRMRQPGPPAQTVQAVATADDHIVTNGSLYRPSGTIQSGSGTAITLATGDGAKFAGGDLVTWDTGNPAHEVLRVEGDVVRLVDALAAPIPTTGTHTLHFPDLPATATAFRAGGVAALAPGMVIRLERQTTGTKPTLFATVKSVAPGPGTTFRVELRAPLGQVWPLDVDTQIRSEEFDLKINVGGTLKADYPRLGMDPEHPRYVVDVVGGDQAGLVLVEHVKPPTTSQPPNDRPNDTKNLAGGTADDPSALSDSDYVKALALLEGIDDVNLLLAPDRISTGTQQALVQHATKLNRFAILDPRLGAGSFGANSVSVWRAGVEQDGGHAAIYYPWIQVTPAIGSKPLLVPPSGNVAGVYAAVDDRRGVHKAPAGFEASLVALGVERTMGNDEQGQLNLEGINVIRVFAGGGRPLVWGTRTVDSKNKYWQYVNVRRLFTYIERSLERALASSLFEPNNPTLWKQLRRSITAFLTKAWEDGALFGETAKEAFYVRIDEALNPPSERALGRLYIEIGLRPSYPAEFIVVRIGVWEGGSEVTEA
jgi:uncharacterized protein